MRNFKILFASLIVSVSLFSFSCSSGQMPAAVCEYGQVVCNISQTLCNAIPGVPTEICDYINLACYDLEILCNNAPETVAYKEALLSLEFINSKLTNLKYSYETKQQK
jgi:hypothetical protein